MSVTTNTTSLGLLERIRLLADTFDDEASAYIDRSPTLQVELGKFLDFHESKNCAENEFPADQDLNRSGELPTGCLEEYPMAEMPIWKFKDIMIDALTNKTWKCRVIDLTVLDEFELAFEIILKGYYPLIVSAEDIGERLATYAISHWKTQREDLSVASERYVVENENFDLRVHGDEPLPVGAIPAGVPDVVKDFLLSNKRQKCSIFRDIASTPPELRSAFCIVTNDTVATLSYGNYALYDMPKHILPGFRPPKKPKPLSVHDLKQIQRCRFYNDRAYHRACGGRLIYDIGGL